jgi:hypothetical protein
MEPNSVLVFLHAIDAELAIFAGSSETLDFYKDVKPRFDKLIGYLEGRISDL